MNASGRSRSGSSYHSSSPNLMPRRRMDHSVCCPFCGYKADEEYTMLLHMETFHSEGRSPFVAEDARDEIVHRNSDEDHFGECPVDGCGEVLTLAELEDHLELHAAEDQAMNEGNDTSRSPRRYTSPYQREFAEESSSPMPHSHQTSPPAENRQAASIHKWRQLLNMPSSSKHSRSNSRSHSQSPRKRLGKAELGKYAHEDKMPSWLVTLLDTEGQITSTGVIPVLEQLLYQSSGTEYAYLCHPSVIHVSKLKREGGFCGYRNIQMLSSYIIGARVQGSEHFRGRLPSIFKIQDFIEDAWDRGINSQGRIETGGVRGTRKYIGTPEAQAVFVSLGIPCQAQGFKSRTPGVAESLLFDFIVEYFESARLDRRAKVRCTSLPPIYFQHRGHSLTIVGLEKRENGALELLVFDPMFHDAPGVTRYIGRIFHHKSPDTALRLYRRGNKYLKKYHEFEVLRLKQARLSEDDQAIR